MKRCTRCRTEKPLSEFWASPETRDGYRRWCKDCERAAEKPEVKRKSVKAYRLKSYGLTYEDYDKLLLQQENRCAICRGSMDPVCIDHCHTTGVVRGLLCSSCNKGIGFLKDSPELLETAISYLKEQSGT